MRKITAITVFLSLCLAFIIVIPSLSASDKEEPKSVAMASEIIPVCISAVEFEPEHEFPIVVEEETEEVEELLPDEDIALIALVTMAEAEGECEEGKRLVIDTILNRMDSEHFPDTAYDVIYQPHQFSSMWNGRVDRCEVREDICQLVREELKSRTNYDVIFFTAGCYSDYGVPMFQVGNHYFSSYE